MNPATAIDLGIRLPYTDPAAAWCLLAESWEANDITTVEFQAVWHRWCQYADASVTVVGGAA